MVVTFCFMVLFLLPVTLFNVPEGPHDTDQTTFRDPFSPDHHAASSPVPVIAGDTSEVDFFEGTLHYVLDIDGLPQNLRYRIRKNLIRLEIDDPLTEASMTILTSPQEDRMVVLVDEIHAFIEITSEDITGRDESLIDRVDRITETGNREVIAHTECREYLITTAEGDSIRLWSPVESTPYGFFRFPDFGNRILINILNNDLIRDLFPFSIIYHGEKSSIELTLTRIEEEIPDPELFTVPANYRKLAVPMPDF